MLNKKKLFSNGYRNMAHKCISPEDVIVNTEYAFTFNPSFTPYGSGNRIHLSTYYNELVDVFKSLKYCQIRLYHEISSKGKFHLHGYIKIIDVMDFYILDLPILRKEGTYEIDVINDDDVWKKYVLKGLHIMEPYCKKHKMPYELCNYDGYKILYVKKDALQNITKKDLITDVYDDSDDDVEKLYTEIQQNKPVKYHPTSED